MTHDHSTIALTRDYKGKGAAPYILASGDGEAGPFAFWRLVRALERRHAETYPDAPAPDPQMATQVLQEASRLLDGAHAAAIRTPCGNVLFYDSDRIAGHEAERVAADEFETESNA